MARSFGAELECLVDNTMNSAEALDVLADVIRPAVLENGQDLLGRGSTRWNTRTTDYANPPWIVKTDSSVRAIRSRPRASGVELVSPPLRGAEGERQLRNVLRAIERYNRQNDDRIFVNINAGHHMHHDLKGATFFPFSDSQDGIGFNESVKRSVKAASILGNLILVQSYWVNCIDRLLAPSRRCGHDNSSLTDNNDWAAPWMSNAAGYRQVDLQMGSLLVSPASLGHNYRSSLTGNYDFQIWKTAALRNMSEGSMFRNEIMVSGPKDWGRCIAWYLTSKDYEYQYSRYSSGRANLLTSYRGWGTVEFRQHQGTLSAEKVIQWMRLTQKMVTIAYAPEHRPKLEALAEGAYDPNSMQDFFDFIGLKAGAKKFWAQRALHFHGRLLHSRTVDGLLPDHAPSRFTEWDATRTGGSNLAYLNSLI